MVVHCPLCRYQVRQRPQHLLSRFPVAIVFLFVKAAAEETNMSSLKAWPRGIRPGGTHDVMKIASKRRRNSLHVRKARKPLVASRSSDLPCMLRLLKL